MTASNDNTFTFSFRGIELRAFEIDGQPWFVAADVCRALGFEVGAGKSTTRYLTSLAQADKQRVSKVPTLDLRGAPYVTAISEAGLYQLTMRAQRSNPQARGFQDWVTGAVLPAIRKDGSYVMGEEKVVTGEMTEDELILKAMQAMQRKTERLQAEVAAQAAVIDYRQERVTVREFLAQKVRETGVYFFSSLHSKIGTACYRLSLAQGIESVWVNVRDEKGSYENRIRVWPRHLLEEAFVQAA